MTTHLIDHGDDGLEDLTLEGPEDDALVLDGEGDVAGALPDEPLADVLHSRDRHHEPVPPAARQEREQHASRVNATPTRPPRSPRYLGLVGEGGGEPYLQVPSTSFMSLETSLSRRCGPKCRGWSCMFRSSTMWKNILLRRSLDGGRRRRGESRQSESFLNAWC